MALVDKDHMTELRPASDAATTAATAEVDIQTQAVAYAINSASNTGERRTVFQGVLLPDVEEDLVSKGYTLKHIGEAHPDYRVLISW